MAPNVPPKPTPPRRSLTLKGAERKKPGPAPKPLSERLKNKPLKQVKRIERSYTRERKVEVLLYLLQHRVPDPRPRKVPRRRIGQPHEEELTQPMVTNEYGELVWYRAPTYSEASEFWKIPTPTIQGWWDAREKILEGTGFELPQVGPGGVSTALAEQVGPEGISRALAEAVQTQMSGVPQEGRQRNETAPSAGGTSAANGAPPTPSSNPSSSPNAASAPSNTTPTPAPAPVAAPSPVPRPSPGAQSTPMNGTPSTLTAIGTQPQQQQQPPPPRPISVAPRGPNGGVRAAGIRAPRLAPAPAPVPVGHAVPQAAPHVAGPTPGYAGPHSPPHPGIPPAFNPAHYVVLYTGPHPGPWEFPGQQWLAPGIVLPIVYANQPVGVGPAGFVSVYPAPVPNSPPPPPPPSTLHHHHHNNHTGQHNIPYAHAVHPNSMIPPVVAPHHHHHLPHPNPHQSQRPPQPPSINGQPPITPGGGPSPPAAQAPYPGPAGYVSPYAPPGVAGPRAVTAAHSPPPTPTANTEARKQPKVAIPKLAPKRTHQETQQSPLAPPPPSVQPSISAKHEQPTADVDGNIAAKVPQQVQTSSEPSDGEQDTSDRPTPSDAGVEGDGNQTTSQASSSPEGENEVAASEEIATVPAEDTAMETETSQTLETSTENSTAERPAVPEVVSTEEMREDPMSMETDHLALAEQSESPAENDTPSSVDEDTLMEIDTTERDADSSISPSEQLEDEGGNTAEEAQFETPAETPSMGTTAMEDVLMQVSIETPGAVLSEFMSPEEEQAESSAAPTPEDAEDEDSSARVEI